jgi:hypothetical protein
MPADAQVSYFILCIYVIVHKERIDRRLYYEYLERESVTFSIMLLK